MKTVQGFLASLHTISLCSWPWDGHFYSDAGWGRSNFLARPQLCVPVDVKEGMW